MEWAPRASVVVVKVAWPAVSVSGAPRLVTPSLNCTVPEGVPEPEVTVAVKDTDWPGIDGFGPADRTRAVAVGARDTVVPLRISTAA